MMINSNTMVSITEANQNFSKVARLVDEQGSAVILKNKQMQAAQDEDIMQISARLIQQNRAAYEELAK